MADFIPYASPEEQALDEEDRIRSYYSAQPNASVQPTTAPTPVEDPAAAYYGTPPPPAAPAPAPAYQPNPGLPNYNPNPGAASSVAPSTTAPTAVLGRSDKLDASAFKSGAQLVDSPDLVKAPSVPSGPSAADDAAYAKYLAQQQSIAPKRPSLIGSSGAGAVNRDPYGQKAATDKLLGTFDEERDAAQREGWATSAKALAVSDKQGEFARRREEDAQLAQAEQEESARQFDMQMGELQQQMDDVRTKKIRPMSHMEAAGEIGAFGVIAAMLSGFSEGLHGRSGNPYIEHLDRIIDRQIAVDEKNLDNERTGITQRMSLLGQQRQIFNDREQAKAATRQLYYESFKESIAAEAAKYDAPIYSANADRAISAIDRQQAMMQKELADRAAAKAAAAASANFAHAKEVRDFRRGTWDQLIKEGYDPETATKLADWQTAHVYATGLEGAHPKVDAQMMGIGKTNREKMAADRLEAQATSDEFNKQVDALVKHRALDDLGLTTGPLATIGGQRLAPGSSKTVQDLEQINTQIINAIGKVAKDAEGKPNVAMMERYEHRFTINPSDTKEIAIQKLEGARNVVNSLARQHGAERAPSPSAKQDRDQALGAHSLRK